MTLIFRSVLIHFIFLLSWMPFVAKAAIYSEYRTGGAGVTRTYRDVLHVKWGPPLYVTKDRIRDLYVYKNRDLIGILNPLDVLVALRNFKIFGPILKEYFRIYGRSIKFIDFDLTTAYITPWSVLYGSSMGYVLLNYERLSQDPWFILPIMCVYAMYRIHIMESISTILARRNESKNIRLFSILASVTPGVDLFFELSLRLMRSYFLLSDEKHMPVSFKTLEAYEAMLRSLPNKMK
jgi:hypothetical protein